MNFIVTLDPQAGELEKILSGTKSMLVKEIDPDRTNGQPIHPGDSLFFLRNKDEYALQVKATVVRLLYFTDPIEDGLSHILKEMQPRLQLTEEQYNHWSVKGQVLLVEFNSAHKIDMVKISSNKMKDRSNWSAFEGFSSITD